ncbi:MAG: hypothetical protein ACLRJ3_16010 [Thomasclavelia ramosa]
MTCDKAPKIVTLEDFNGDYIRYEQEIYNLFSKDFINRNIYFKGTQISHKKYPKHKGMSATFWHIVTNGDNETNREPNLRRYETICYPAFIIEECSNYCSNVLIWENIRKGKTRILIYCTTLRYLVVLDKRTDYILFWTSYPVEYKNRHEKLINEFNEYKAKTANQLND